MTILILSLILLGYMKLTGKTIPAVEKRLDKLKHAKDKTSVVGAMDIEMKSINMDKVENVVSEKAVTAFKSKQTYPKIYSGNLKV